MSYGMRNIIKLTPSDDYGVYISRSRGPLGTPLQFRGTWDEVTNLDIEVHMRDCVITKYNPDTKVYAPVPVSERGLGAVDRGW